LADLRISTVGLNRLKQAVLPQAPISAFPAAEN